jgi:hypothetical protein
MSILVCGYVKCYRALFRPSVTVRRRCCGFVGTPASILRPLIDFGAVPTFPKNWRRRPKKVS